MKLRSLLTPRGRRLAAPVLGIALAIMLGILFLNPGKNPRQSEPVIGQTTTGSAMDSALTSYSGGGAETKNQSIASMDPARLAQVNKTLASISALEKEWKELAADTSLTPEERAERSRLILERLRGTLRDLPADVASAAIVAYLDSGSDAATGLGFTLANGGILDAAPTVRTAMLDLLAQIDPGVSVDYARRIFESSPSSDEWALAMRNVGWQNQDRSHSPELRRQLQRMLDNPTWLANPTPGFFEAFDVAVHLGGVEEITTMASVVRLEDQNGNRVENGATHAAMLAIDRIVASNPTTTLPALANDPELLSWSPEHRAGLLARADVRDPAQRAALEQYLATLSSRPEELATFTALFPNRNGTLGNALISTPLPEVPHEDLLAGDRAARALLLEWSNSNRFPGIHTNLRQITDRIGGFLESSSSQ